MTDLADTRLPRTLGPVAATSIVIGGIIGSGIFISPAIVAREVGTPGMSLMVWVVGGLIAACGSLCYAELSSALPMTGGTYVFLKRAYRSRPLAFLFGWSAFFVTFPGPIAAVAG
ncbi:MAG: amino acid permease, partial [Gemmatimonadota bacterium]